MAVHDGHTAAWVTAAWHLTHTLARYDERLSPCAAVPLAAVHGSGPNDVWAVGAHGAVRHSNGTSFAKWTVPAGNVDTAYLSSVWGSSATSAWAVGLYDQTILRWNGAAWSIAFSKEGDWFYSVWGSSDSDVWAGGVNLAHWNGSAWSVVTGAPVVGGINGIWGSTARDVWAVGGGILHWDGSAWTRFVSYSPPVFNSVWGSAPTDVWAVGDASRILHWNGLAWSTVSIAGSKNLKAVWGTDLTHVWIAGTGNTLLRWDGTTWRAAGAVTGDFNALWGTSDTDVWALGNGVVVHWDGTSWTNEALPPGAQPIKGAWGTAADNILAVGDNGMILRRH